MGTRGAPLSAGPTFQDISGYLAEFPTALKDDRAGVLAMLEKFVRANENPSVSPNFRSNLPDRVQPLVRLMRDPLLEGDAELILPALKVFKILSRKQDNRLALKEASIRSILKHVQKPKTTQIAAEGANFVLNICYEKQNVASVLNCNGVQPLVEFLKADEETLTANAAGAIQSISFQERGRAKVREAGAIPFIARLLRSRNSKVQARAAGAIHNLSSDPHSIRIIRQHRGIEALVEILTASAQQVGVKGSAAGALQNIAREVESRQILKRLKVVGALTKLLLCDDLQVQVCAAGAIINIIGPDFGEEGATNLERAGFGKLLAQLMALSMAYWGIYGREPEVSLRQIREGVANPGFLLPGAVE